MQRTKITLIRLNNYKIMNENIDLTKILADCPEGTKLFCTDYGYAEFEGIDKEDDNYPIKIKIKDDTIRYFTKDGYIFPSECRDKYAEPSLLPAHDQRDWSKFEVPNKKVKVTLHPFDKVLVRLDNTRPWFAQLVTLITNERIETVDGDTWYDGIPYNKDTAHLLGTIDECPIDYKIEFSNEFKEK
jgi:hypothetical protein